MCGISHTVTDEEIFEYLANHDYDGEYGDMTEAAKTARKIAQNYRAARPKPGEVSDVALMAFRGTNGKILPLSEHQRKALADLIYPPDDPLDGAA